MHRALAATTLTLLLLAVAVGDALALEGSQYRNAVRSGGGVVASESPAAAEAGLDVLDAGGNAKDAAVARTFPPGVARPQSCGIGGGGFLVYRGADGEAAALDFREAAPAGVTPETFAGQGLYKTFTGHTTVGVPGTVAGMQAALESYGTIDLADAIAPAERIARQGAAAPHTPLTEQGKQLTRLRLYPQTATPFPVAGAGRHFAGALLVDWARHGAPQT